MPSFSKQIFGFLILLVATLTLSAEDPVLSDWEPSFREWQVSMCAVTECGNADAPAIPAELQKESSNYQSYLQAKFLLSNSSSPEKADPEIIVPLLVQAIEAFPDVSQPVWELTVFRDARKENEKLIEDLTPLAERHPNSIYILRSLSAALLDAHRQEEAEAVLRQMLALDSRDPMNLFFWGQFLFEQRRTEELENVIQAINTLPDDQILPDHLILEIRHYRQQQKFDEALRTAKKLIDTPAIYYDHQLVPRIPDILNSLHAWELQRTFVERFEEIHADDQIPVRLRRQLCQVCTNANLELRDYDALSQYLEKLIATAGFELELFNIFSAPIELLIDDDERQDKDRKRLLQLSARAYETMMVRAPQNMQYRRHLCILYNALDAPQKALAVLSTIISPTLEDELFKAQLLAQLKRYDEALAIWEKYESVPQNRQYLTPNFYLIYGCIAEEAGQTELSLRILRRGNTLFPRHSGLANSLGYILADHHQDLDEAKRLIEFAVKASPTSPAYLDSLAWVYYRLGNYGEALVYMGKAFQNASLPLQQLDQEFRDHLQAILEANDFPLMAEFFAMPTEIK
ncbi:MAG: tetratricopeptide repeat protein [Victivallales bacterium]|nr:tetratricopeptide repeat protein [Victivallales bacterium]